MPETDPYAATAIKAPEADPYASTAVAAATPESTPDAPPPSTLFQRMKANFNANTQHVEHKPGESGLDRLRVDAANTGAGGAKVIKSLAHPIDTAISTAKSFEPDPGAAGVVESAFGPAGPFVKHNAEALIADPAGYVGQMGVGTILGKMSGAGLDTVVDSAGSVASGAKTVAQKGLRSLTKTGPSETAKFVTETARANEDAIKAAEVKNAANEDRADDINARRQSAYDQRKAQYDTKKAAFDEAQAKAAEVEKASQETESRRGELARQTKQNSARLVERVKRVAAQTKGKLDQSYAQIGEATKGQSVPASDLRSAVETAQSKLKGSAESIKQFKDILSKAPDEDAPIEYQGSMIPKGHALYGVLAEGMDTGKPFGFDDLRGYYSEIGEKLTPGDLLPDVYQALRSLQDSLNGMQKNLASKAGVGAKFTKTQAAYRDYMQTFREAQGPNHSGSPIASALQAEDPAYAIEPFTNPKTQARIRNMIANAEKVNLGDQVGPLTKEQIEETDPNKSAARLYDNFLKGHRDFEGLPKPGGVGRALTPPTPPIARPPVKPRISKPDIKVISPETIHQLKADNALGGRVRSDQLATTLTGVNVARQALKLNPGGVAVDLGARAGYGIFRKAFARALESPSVVNALTKLTPEDVAHAMRLPEDQRTGFMNLVQEAEKQGVKLDPAVRAAITAGGAAAGGAAPKKRVAAALTMPARTQPTVQQPDAAPQVVTQSFAGKQVPGLISKGNLDITKRPNIDNGDGTHSSTFSMSFGTDAGETLVPGVGDGVTYPLRKLSTKEALDQFRKTGKNFGTFKDVKSANAYGKVLHEDQAKYGNNGASGQ